MWTSRLQLEWLYRLLQEPARWRRYLALPQFVWAVWFSGSRQRPAKRMQVEEKRAE